MLLIGMHPGDIVRWKVAVAQVPNPGIRAARREDAALNGPARLAELLLLAPAVVPRAQPQRALGHTVVHRA